MQNMILKLTAIAGVIGIGCLGLLQAQRGMNGGNEPPSVGGSVSESHERLPAEDSAVPPAAVSDDARSSEPQLPSDLQLAQTEPDVDSLEGTETERDGQSWPEPGSPDTPVDTEPAENHFAARPTQTTLPPRPEPEPAPLAGNGLDFNDPSPSWPISESSGAPAEPQTDALSEPAPPLLPVQQTVAEVAESPTATPTASDGDNDSSNDSAGEGSRPSTAAETPSEPPRPVPEVDDVSLAGAEVSESMPQADPFTLTPPDPATRSATATNDDAVSKKAEADRLIRQARLDLKEGRIETARQKALEADELQATYAVFEDRPAAILLDIQQVAGDKQTVPLSVAKDEKPEEPIPAEATRLPLPAESTKDVPAQSPDPEPPAFNPFVSPDRADLPSAKLADETAAEAREPMGVADTEKELTTPNRLTLPHNATPLDPSNEERDEALEGDGTVSDDTPRGQQRPQLTIEKIAPSDAVLGQPLVYSIVIKNVGESAAHDVVVEDQIPRGSKLSGTIPRAELSGKRLVWRMGTVAPGEEKRTSVRIVPTVPGPLGSVATVNFVSEIAAKTLITAPKLEFDVTASKQVELGKPVVFHFKVVNRGNGDATGVFIRNAIPEAFQHPDGNDLEYPVGTLPAGKTFDVQLTMTAAKPGRAVNRASVTADGNISIEAESAVEITGSRLVITRTGPIRRHVGRPAMFTNTITNDSSEPVAGATVVETLPEGMEFSKASAGGQFHAGQRTIAWSIDGLAPGQSKALAVTLIPKLIGTPSSTVTVVDADGNQAQVESQTEVVGVSSLSVDLSEMKGSIACGEQVSVRLGVKNRGTAAASNVVVRLRVPPEIRFVRAEGNAKHTVEGEEIVFRPIVAIAGGAEVVIPIVLEAVKAADARLVVQIQSDQMERPLNREESLVIIPDEPPEGTSP